MTAVTAVTAEPVPTYQLKIVLRDTSPPIWRRVTLPADTSHGCLHDTEERRSVRECLA